MPKKNPLDFTVSINSISHNTQYKWISETNKSPQRCELFLVKFCKLSIFFFLHITL